MLQHGIAEPAGLGHWSKASVAVLRGLALLPKLRFCQDLLPDERAHAREQVQRVTVRLKDLAESERHREATAVLCSAPGMGVLMAAAFRPEPPEPQRAGGAFRSCANSRGTIRGRGHLALHPVEEHHDHIFKIQ